MRLIWTTAAALLVLALGHTPAIAQLPTMTHIWKLEKTSWGGACAGMTTTLLTPDQAGCNVAKTLGYSGSCVADDTTCDHYVATSPFTGSKTVWRLTKACLGCKDVNIVTADTTWKNQLVADGWAIGNTFYAWDATGKGASWYQEWGLVPIWHGYKSSICDNSYTEHTDVMNVHYSQGYTTGPSSEPVMIDPHNFDSVWKSVAYAASDGWVDLTVTCSGYTSCSWHLEGPGGFTQTGTGTWSRDKLPSHRYKLTCYDVVGMSNDTPFDHSNLEFFQDHTLTCVHSCDHECSFNGQKECVGSSYRVCQTNSKGCRYWSGTTTCSDGNQCTNDGCSGGVCTYTNNSASCDDGNPCTLNDYCSGGSCQSGNPKDCNDWNPCTNDQCVGGSCQNSPVGGGCDDGNACTSGDSCSGGSCIGTPIVCSDGNGCTDDYCSAGVCQHPPIPGPCDDGSACTTNDSCSNGACVGGPALDCSDTNPCTADSCSPALGCVHTPQAGACDDGNACTTDDACSGGTCVAGPALDCVGPNPCMDYGCDTATGCTAVPNSNPCDDGLACTEGDTCINGGCQGTLPAGCDDLVDCTEDSCSEADGCVNTPVDLACADGNPCTTDTCNPASGCELVEHTGPCSDSNPCTVGDACDSGLCIPGDPKTCDDGLPCTADSCDPATGCVFTPDNTACDDGVTCTEDACDLQTGCTNQPVHAACDDGNECTSDTCDAVTGCLNAVGALNCDDGNPCTTDSCVPGSGCQFQWNTLPCDDGNPCTVGDACSNGSCVEGAQKSCDDNNPCTLETCDPGIDGGCVYQPQGGTCDDGDACTENDHCADGACVGGTALVCNDADPCTEDTCEPALGCVFPEANGAPCSDGNPCTIEDSCDSGKCLPGGPKDCNDGKECTVDSCDPDVGCLNIADDSMCDDGDECTTDTCNEATGSCETDLAPGCCLTIDDCPVPQGCSQVKCISTQCQVLPGCVAGEVCVFGACYPLCTPPKETTKCGESAATLYECLSDPSNDLAGWIPTPCEAPEKCAYNADLDRFHCCQPACDGRECGMPSECMIPCGTCTEGWACVGPNEELVVAGSHPEAFSCAPGCQWVADEVGEGSESDTYPAPECGPSLVGTVGVGDCGTCGGDSACYEGQCMTACESLQLPDEGRCSGQLAQWCDSGTPQEVDCLSEGSYCCAAGDAGNEIDHATCCSCEFECDVKGWACGKNSCGQLCGDPETDDGCQAGYDCQGRTCVCTTPSLCGGTAEVEDVPDRRANDLQPSGDATAEIGLGDVPAQPGTQPPGGCDDCSNTEASTGAAPALLFALAFLLVWRRRSTA